MTEKGSDTGDLIDQERYRLEKLGRIRERGDHPYRNDLKPKNLASEIRKKYDEFSKEELEKKAAPACVAGRILAVRDFGKSCFLSVRDRSDAVQLYVQRAVLGETEWIKFKDLDLGDIVLAEGTVFKTKTGELSIQVSRLVLLTKSLKPLPEKFHGLTDIEIRYRQRYLDLMLNEKTRETIRKRALLVDLVRRFFLERDFIEVETPMMHPLIGGATARPFETHHNALDMKLYMRIAPELYLKRLLVGGLERVFEINRNFRNEGVSVQHNPEFTMIEFYEAYATFQDFMTLTEQLFERLSREVCGSLDIPYQGQTIHMKGPWERLTVEEAIMKYSGFKDRAKLRDKKALVAYGEKYGAANKDSVGHLQMKIFDEEVEKKLIQPVFITHYPVDVSPLSRKNELDPFVVDRFELYISGREIANAFSELNDPHDQKERFLAQLEAKKAGDLEACDMDDDYVTALEYGMPPAAGQGIGIDRLAMLLTDSASIRDVILFPLMRPHS